MQELLWVCVDWMLEESPYITNMLYMLDAFYFLIHSLLWVYLRISFTTYASSDTGVCVSVGECFLACKHAVCS